MTRLNVLVTDNFMSHAGLFIYCMSRWCDWVSHTRTVMVTVELLSCDVRDCFDFGDCNISVRLRAHVVAVRYVGHMTGFKCKSV